MQMQIRIARQEDVAGIAALIARSGESKPSSTATGRLRARTAPEIVTSVCRDLETPHGQIHWVVVGAAADPAAAAQIAVIPPPPIYDLEGGLAGIVLGHWSRRDIAAETLVAALERHLRERSAAMLVIACHAEDEAACAAATAHGYRATTNFLVKATLTPNEPATTIRTAVEDDIPALVAFNREARDRLHEANPVFWRSHPEAETRFGLWMKFSLTMRDRTIFVSHEGGRATGFIVAQPANPIPLSIASDDSIGAIDDFHCPAFGHSLTAQSNDRSGDTLLAAAETDFVERGKTAAMAVCPAAWPAKSALLERAGYQTEFTWFTKKA